MLECEDEEETDVNKARNWNVERNPSGIRPNLKGSGFRIYGAICENLK